MLQISKDGSEEDVAVKNGTDALVSDIESICWGLIAKHDLQAKDRVRFNEKLAAIRSPQWS
jgi:hypothetical protein